MRTDNVWNGDPRFTVTASDDVCGMKLRVRRWGKQRHTEHVEHDERTGIFDRSINFVIKRVFVCSTESERTERTVRCLFIAHPASTFELSTCYSSDLDRLLHRQHSLAHGKQRVAKAVSNVLNIAVEAKDSQETACSWSRYFTLHLDLLPLHK